MYVYIQSEPGLWTVGFYDPQGNWQSESDHAVREQAAERVHWINGGGSDRMAAIEDRLQALEAESERQQKALDTPDWRERR